MAGLDIHLHDLVESQVPSLAGREQGELTDYARQLLLTYVALHPSPSIDNRRSLTRLIPSAVASR